MLRFALEPWNGSAPGSTSYPVQSALQRPRSERCASRSTSARHELHWARPDGLRCQSSNSLTPGD